MGEIKSNTSVVVVITVIVKSMATQKMWGEERNAAVIINIMSL